MGKIRATQDERLERANGRTIPSAGAEPRPQWGNGRLGPNTGRLWEKGEAPKRGNVKSNATAGRHTSAANVRTWDKKDPVADERAASVLARRKETEALFDSHRKKSSSV